MCAPVNIRLAWHKDEDIATFGALEETQCSVRCIAAKHFPCTNVTHLFNIRLDIIPVFDVNWECRTCQFKFSRMMLVGSRS
jgi:hypothetical protein